MFRMIAPVIGAHTEPPLSTLSGMPVTAIRGQLDRVLHSRVFIHSHRIRRFLEFVVGESLTGQQHRLKEYLIGLEVFNRTESFDPRVDSIVRVEARRLRAKLDHYYRTEGNDDEIRIEMRKGSYVPYFEPKRDGQHDYPFQPAIRKKSIAFAPFTIHPAGDSDDLLNSIKRRITHVLTSEGFSQVIHDQGGDGSAASIDFVLHGDVERDDKTLKVMLQLMSVSEGACVWSTEGAEIDELARSLNRALVTNNSRSDRGRSQRHRSQSRSFDSYVQGRYLWKTGSPEALSRSAEFFQLALEKEPSDAIAWAALAQSLMVSSLFGFEGSKEVTGRIEDAARKALELDDGLPDTHLALGASLSLIGRKWQQGEQAILRALQLNGRDSTIYAVYALQLACRGMTHAALVQVERALELDPACLNSNFILGWLQGLSGNFDQAVAQHNLTARLAPDFALTWLGLGWALGTKGMWAAAIENFEKAASLLKGSTLLPGCLGFAQAKMGNRREALQQLDVLKNWTGDFVPHVSLAAVYVGLGENERSLDHLDTAVTAQECCLPLRLPNPEFRELRSEPRFSSLLARIGLKPLASPEYITAPTRSSGRGVEASPRMSPASAQLSAQ